MFFQFQSRDNVENIIVKFEAFVQINFKLSNIYTKNANFILVYKSFMSKN